MKDHSYSREFVKKAETQIKRQLDGNDVDLSTITLTVAREGIDTLTAQTSYKFDCKVDTKLEKGKSIRGNVIKSGTLDTEIKRYIESFTTKDTLDILAKDKIKNLPLLGFGSDKTIIELSAEKKIFTEHVNCSACHGKGQSQCQKCQGKTRIQCQKCFGRGESQCPLCHGHRQIQSGGESKQCYECMGRGEVLCINCQGKRTVPCQQCHMKGHTTCHNCKGEGLNTNFATLSPFIITSAAINVQNLELDTKRMAGKIGGLELASGGHIQMKVVEPTETKHEVRAYYEDDPEDNTKTSLFYEGAFAWAVAHVKIKSKQHDITFAGNKGAVCESGNFMELVIDPYLQKMDRATRGQVNAQDAIKEACTLRVSRETFSMIGVLKPKKIMQQLYKRYPLGWTKNTIKAYVTTCYNTLKIATRRLRYTGLAIGLLVSLVGFYLWFVTGLNVNFAIPSQYKILLDGIPLIVGITVTFIVIKATGFITYRALMKDIGIKSKKAPPTGMAGLYGFVGNLIMWGGFIVYPYLKNY